MMRHAFRVIWMVLFALAFIHTTDAAEHGRPRPEKTGILLVAFGSSLPEAQVSFSKIEEEVKTAFPGIPVHWAFTSTTIRKKLAKQGKILDSPEIALAKMLDEGFTRLAVQSLHTIAGKEFHDLHRSVRQFQHPGGFKRIVLGDPLLSAQEDMVRAKEAVFAAIPKERRKEDGVLLMGHGTHHPSNASYTALMFQIQRKDPRVFIGCVDGYPEIDEIMEMFKERGIRRTYLMPFMSVAGDHARNDMAGDRKDSWKSVLTLAGIECIPILRGTAEYDDFVAIWTDHLKEALEDVAR